MMETYAKAIMERLNHIEQIISEDAEDENLDRLLRESEIRQEMRIDHARRLLQLGVEAEKIGAATGLTAEFVRQLGEETEK